MVSRSRKKKRKTRLLPGDKAHDIIAPAVVEEKMVRFYMYTFLKKFILMLFYPNDFPMLCCDELSEFSARIDEFRDIDCEILGISTESHFAHLAYVTFPATRGGLGGKCTFPLISDKTLEISKRYKMLHPGAKLCYRGSVLVDPHGRVVYVAYNDWNHARKADVLLSIVTAHRVLVGQNSEGKECSIPEGWTPGDAILVQSKDSNAGEIVKKSKNNSKTQTSMRLLIDDDSKKMKKKAKEAIK